MKTSKNLETTKRFIFSDVNTKVAYQIRAIVDSNMILDQSFISESEDDENKMIISMIESDTLWERNDYEKFIASMRMSKRMSYLTKYTPEDLANENVQTFKLKGYNIGFALKPVSGTNDVDIISVHNNSGVHGIGSALVMAAVKNGGTVLDHFDGFLSKFYSSLGFKEYGRLQWDENYAPEDWNYELNGRPDVVLRRYEK